jgi:hypothetical protein
VKNSCLGRSVFSAQPLGRSGFPGSARPSPALSGSGGPPWGIDPGASSLGSPGRRRPERVTFWSQRPVGPVAWRASAGRKVPSFQGLRVMGRTGIEPVTLGLKVRAEPRQQTVHS